MSTDSVRTMTPPARSCSATRSAACGVGSVVSLTTRWIDRSADPAEDAVHKELLRDAKTTSELLMVVDMVRHDLARVCLERNVFWQRKQLIIPAASPLLR